MASAGGLLQLIAYGLFGGTQQNGRFATGSAYYRPLRFYEKIRHKRFLKNLHR
jgi:hypothetical protein